MSAEGGDRRREGKDARHRQPSSSREDDDDDGDEEDEEDDTGELEETPSKFKLSGDVTGSGIEYNVLDEDSWQKLEVYCKVIMHGHFGHAPVYCHYSYYCTYKQAYAVVTVLRVITYLLLLLCSTLLLL